MSPEGRPMPARRDVLVAGLGVVGCMVLRPAAATPETLRAAVAAFTGGAPVRDGRVLLDIAPLVENGNTVPMTVTVDSPMSAADHVVSVAVFNERNPQREVANFFLGPRAGRAVISSR